MMKKKDYYERLFDRLKEAYSESDVVKIISKRLSNAQIEIGILKSEIEEKDYIIEQQKKEIYRLRNIEQLLVREVKEMIELRQELERKKEENQELINKKY